MLKECIRVAPVENGGRRGPCHSVMFFCLITCSNILGLGAVKKSTLKVSGGLRKDA